MDTKTLTLPDFAMLEKRMLAAIGPVELVPGSLTPDQRYLDFLPARDGKIISNVKGGPRFDLSTITDMPGATIPVLTARAAKLVNGTRYAIIPQFPLISALYSGWLFVNAYYRYDEERKAGSFEEITAGIEVLEIAKSLGLPVAFLVSSDTKISGLDLSRPVAGTLINIMEFLVAGWKERANAATEYAFELSMHILKSAKEFRDDAEKLAEYRKSWHLFDRSKKMQKALDFSREELEKAAERYAALMEAAEVGTDEALKAVVARFKPERMQTLGIKE